MTYAARWTKMLMALLVVVVATGSGMARANDLPLAAASPLTGVAFDDRPLLLPVQRNFQMAMLTAGSELGRSCGNMEAYGWRMSQTEQGRVNQIFNNTVDRMRMMGYTIAPQALTSVSNDITLFTADSRDKHFIFLWSAGELGLVMTLCETTAPVSATYKPSPLVPSVQTFPVPNDVVSSHLEAPGRMQTKASSDGFTPLGEWQGGYICEQGFTGGSIQITHLNGKDFEGVFKFYPTPKNPNVLAGAYNIYGQYDQASHRILINPGKWINRPPHYYNTVIVGSFDPVRQNFSGFFQGVSGCTSFEASRVGQPYMDFGGKKKKKAARPVVKKKKPAAKKPVAPKTVSTDSILAPLPVSKAPAILTPPVAAPAPVVTPAPAAPPAVAPPAVPAASAPPVPLTAPAAAGLAVAPAVSSAAPAAAANAVVLPTAPVPAPADDNGISLSAPAGGK